MHVKVEYTGINHPNHVKALDKFCLGIQANGDTFEADYPTQKEPDAYVIFGSWKNRDQPHHNAKRKIVESGKPFVVIETPIFGRKPVKDHISDDCFRVGVNTFLNNRGRFVEGNDPSRLQKMVDRLGVEIKEPNTKGTYITLALQLPGDASLEGRNINTWLDSWIRKLEDNPNPKRVRLPQLPREYDREVLNKAIENGWEIQQGSFENLAECFETSKVTISYSSGFGVDSLIAGCPAIVDGNASFAWDLRMLARNGTDFQYSVLDLSEPKKVDTSKRQEWLEKLAYYQWFMDEFEDGRCWEELSKIVLDK